eukprot:TRINITY_DN28263_c0_g1_i1.p1 TRINITY_DN28263_c0_g1~~TRINITY_DN28263_c0_g1_i1.p1  ORF type:complete len:414 (-),score=49.38 TRINITY_DN28263_c0_g1_i1:322-1539(-)
MTTGYMMVDLEKHHADETLDSVLGRRYAFRFLWPVLYPHSRCIELVHVLLSLVVVAYMVYLNWALKTGLIPYATMKRILLFDSVDRSAFAFVFPSLPAISLLLNTLTRSALASSAVNTSIKTTMQLGDEVAMADDIVKRMKESVLIAVGFKVGFLILLTGAYLYYAAAEYLWYAVYAIPFFYPTVTTVVIAHVCIGGIFSRLAKNEISFFRKALPNEEVKPTRWHKLIENHHVLDLRLVNLWAAAGKVIGAGLLAGVFFCIPCLVCGVHLYKSAAAEKSVMEASVKDQLLAIGFFSVVFAIAGIALIVFHPLAQVTALCQSKTLPMSGEKSLLLQASTYGSRDMELQERLEYESFMAHLDRTPIGAELPFVGPIDHAFLASKAVAVASALPLLLAIFLGKGDGGQ